MPAFVLPSKCFHAFFQVALCLLPFYFPIGSVFTSVLPSKWFHAFFHVAPCLLLFLVRVDPFLLPCSLPMLLPSNSTLSSVWFHSCFHACFQVPTCFLPNNARSLLAESPLPFHVLTFRCCACFFASLLSSTLSSFLVCFLPCLPAFMLPSCFRLILMTICRVSLLWSCLLPNCIKHG